MVRSAALCSVSSSTQKGQSRKPLERNRTGQLTNASAPLVFTKRRLLLRDGAVFLILSAVTIALFGVTWFLFQSFEEHRHDLGRTWSGRGQLALQQDRPKDAVNALRIALSYAPNDWADQLTLAQALAAAGHTEEARSYFLNLRDQRPGDGFLNLQLARLARKQGDAQQSVNFYRAAIFGNWEGDGILRRRQTRIELARYLAQNGDQVGAKAELMIAVGNAGEDLVTDQMFADQLVQIGDPADALALYERALQKEPHDASLLARAGRAAYAVGSLNSAMTYLNDAVERSAHGALPEAEKAELSGMAQMAHRTMQLDLSRNLPAVERAQHTLAATQIAQARLTACAVQVSGTAPSTSTPGAPTAQLAKAPLPAQLMDLKAQWSGLSRQLNLHTIERDSVLQDQLVQLVANTETQTANFCGKPTGDNALLLTLATAASK